MRTTLSIDDDVLEAARELAERDRKPVGEVISDLARKGLTPVEPIPQYRNGIRLMPVGPDSRISTLALVNRLREEFE